MKYTKKELLSYMSVFIFIFLFFYFGYAIDKFYYNKNRVTSDFEGLITEIEKIDNSDVIKKIEVYARGGIEIYILLVPNTLYQDEMMNLYRKIIEVVDLEFNSETHSKSKYRDDEELYLWMTCGSMNTGLGNLDSTRGVQAKRRLSKDTGEYTWNSLILYKKD